MRQIIHLKNSLWYHLFCSLKKDSSPTLESVLLSNTRYSHGTPMPCNINVVIMLTVQVQDFNTFTQEYYNSVISDLQMHRLKCSCNRSGCLSIHGYYQRSVMAPSGKKCLTICRVRCSECGCTHALLLSSMVPYSQVSAETQRDIILAYEEDGAPQDLCSSGDGIDENNIKSVIRRYVKFWKQRLLAFRISLVHLPELISSCFSHYSGQFMQIRSTFNNLVALPT